MKLMQKIAINYVRFKLNVVAIFSKKKAATMSFAIFCTPRLKTKKELPGIFAGAEKLSITVSGITVRGFVWNKGGLRRVLILHGFESSCINFEAYIQPFIEKNYEVLAFDAPAHGISDGIQITLPLYMQTIGSIDVAYGPIHRFMAHSFGGLALVHYVENIPHNAGMHLALIAPATETKTAIDDFFQLLQLSKGVRKEFEYLILQKSGVASDHFSILRALEHLQASICWIHDSEDAITPLKDVEPIMQLQLPHLRFLITKGLGHRKIYRNEKVIQAVVDFL